MNNSLNLRISKLVDDMVPVRGIHNHKVTMLAYCNQQKRIQKHTNFNRAIFVALINGGSSIQRSSNQSLIEGQMENNASTLVAEIKNSCKIRS